LITKTTLTVNNKQQQQRQQQQTNKRTKKQTRKQNLLTTPLVIRVAGAVGKIMKNKLMNKFS